MSEDQGSDENTGGDDYQISEEAQQLLNDPKGVDTLLERKRAANAEAKSYREKWESVEKELDSFKAAKLKEQEEAENAKLSDMEKLQKAIDDGQGKYGDLESQFSTVSNENNTLKIHNAALRLGATDPEYVEFKYGKHLSSLSEEDRASADFTTWLTEFKESNSDVFGANSPTPGRTLSKPPGSPPGERPPPPERLPDRLLNPKTAEDRQELEREMNEIIRA